MTKTTTTSPPHAVIYLRMASAAQETNESLDWQRRTCRLMAKRLNATVVKTFTDRGVSGATLDRPGLNTLLRYVTEHDVRYVIANDMARLARPYDVSSQLLVELYKLDCAIALAESDATIEVHLSDENGQIHPTGATSA